MRSVKKRISAPSHRAFAMLAAGLILLSCMKANPPAAAPQSGAAPRASHPELDFFNKISARLEIEMSAPPEFIENTADLRATPTSTITSLKLQAVIVDRDSTSPKGIAARELTAQELHAIAFDGARIELRGEGGVTVSYQAPNGQSFSVQDLLKAVEDTERQSRPNSEWFGGVDVHHIYFEGIHESGAGVWEIQWGS